jgi:two-component system NtrC family sensor kinase
VILNIVNNAVDALGGDPGRIIIAIFTRGRNVCIQIADSGKGMSPEQLGKIFLPFYTTKDVGKGTGLGLSVSYGIVKNLGGDIEVQSRVGEGSTFTIVLPLQ